MPDTMEHDLERYFAALADRVEAVADIGPQFVEPHRRRSWLVMAAACTVLVGGAVALALWPSDSDPDPGPALTDTSVTPTVETAEETTSDVTQPAPMQIQGSWTPIETPGIGGQEETPAAVWMLTDFLVIDTINGGYTPTAARVDPVTGVATPIADPPGNWRYRPTVIWTGREVLMMGGSSGPGLGVFGAAYDPLADSWREIDAPPRVDGSVSAPFESAEVGVWNGSEVVFWAQGWAYQPRTDVWREIAPSPLDPRAFAASVAIGSDVLVWGGCDRAVPECDLAPESWLSDGAVWDAASDVWTALPDGPLRGSPYPTAVSNGIAATVATRYEEGDGSVALYAPGEGWIELPDPGPALGRLSTMTLVGRSVVVIGPTQSLVLHPDATRWQQIPAPGVVHAVADGGGHLLATGSMANGPNHPEVIAIEDAWTPLDPDPIDIEAGLEIREGVPVVAYTQPEFPPGAAYVSLWIDGRLRGRGSAISGSTAGSNVSGLVDDGSIEVQLVVEDIDMYPIAATDPVILTLP